MGRTPVEVGELVIHGAAKNLGIAVLELLIQLAKRSDFGGADKGEVLRVEEHNQPLSWVGAAGNGLKVVLRLRCLNIMQVPTLQRGERELRECIANGQQCHGVPPYTDNQESMFSDTRHDHRPHRTESLLRMADTIALTQSMHEQPQAVKR